MFFQLLLDVGLHGVWMKTMQPCNHVAMVISYLLPHIFASICQILRGRSQRLQSNQPKTSYCFYFSCLDQGMIPRLISPESSALSSRPSYLVDWTVCLMEMLTIKFYFQTARPPISIWKSQKGANICPETRPTHQLSLQEIAASF